MVSNHLELRSLRNFQQVALDWQRRCFDRGLNKFHNIQGASYGELEDYLKDMQKIIHDQKGNFT